MKLWAILKKKWLGMKRDEQDLTFILIFAIIAMTVQALHAPEWVEYAFIFLGMLYIVFTSPKVNEAGNKQESTLDKALKETSVQLKGIEALDEHFKKHPYKYGKKKKGK